MGTSLGTLNMKNTGSTLTPGGTRSRQPHRRVAGRDSPTRPAVGQRPATSEVPIEQPLIWTTSLPRSTYRSTRARRSPVVFVSAMTGPLLRNELVMEGDEAIAWAQYGTGWPVMIHPE